MNYIFNMDIIQIISKYLNIKNILLLSITNKNYYSNKKLLVIENIISKYFSKNIDYYYDKQDYYNKLNNCNFNIELLEYTKKNLKLFNIDNIDNNIDNTFTIFRLAQIINITNNNKNKNKNYIISQLIDYFDVIYNKKYKTISDNNVINKFKGLLLYHNIDLCCLNINLYHIYEIWRILKNNNIKLFKQNFDNNIIYNNNIKCQKITLLYLLQLIDYFQNIKMRFYLIYQTFKYINNIFEKNINTEIIDDIEFINITRQKIDLIKIEIIMKYNNIMPKYFIRNLLNSFNKFLERTS